MHAVFFENADLSGTIAEHDQLLAEQRDPKRIRIGGRQLIGSGDGMPVTAHHLAHRRVASDATERLVFRVGEHVAISLGFIDLPWKIYFWRDGVNRSWRRFCARPPSAHRPGA